MSPVQVIIETMKSHQLPQTKGSYIHYDMSDYDPGDQIPGTGLDEAVRDKVLETPGAMGLVEQIGEHSRRVLYGYADQRHRLVRIIVTCEEGRRASVTVAEEAARYLRTEGINVEVLHRNL